MFRRLRLPGRGSRSLFAGLTAGALCLGLAACGSVQDAAAPSASPAPAGADASAFPVTITHKFGTTTIPKAPQRVVVVGNSTDDLDAVLALGVTPVAYFAKSYTGTDGVPPWLAGKLDPAKTKIVNAGSGVNAEQVGALTPDLILATASFGLDTEYPTLSKIAPTIGYDNAWGDETWQQHLQVVGKALGKTAEANTLATETQAKIDQVKAANAAVAGKTFTASVGNTPGKIFTLISEKDFAVKLIEEIGLKLSPAVASIGKDTAASPTGALSPEQFDKLSADLVVIAFTSPDLQQAFEGNQLVKNLPAVKDGHYVVVDFDTIAQLRAPSVIGIPWALDKLTPALKKLA
jgi:iron complex transport system substrate-binding protein